MAQIMAIWAIVRTQRDVARMLACMSEFVLLQEGYPALLLWCTVGSLRVHPLTAHPACSKTWRLAGKDRAGKQFCDMT